MNTRTVWRFPLALLAVGGFGLVLSQAGEDPANKELEKFQGTWQYTSVVSAGKKAPLDKGTVTITFKGDKFVVKAGDKVVASGTQKLDPTKTPKQVDAIPDAGKGQTTVGIYEIDGDMLKFCFDLKGKKRPTTFEAPAGSTYFLATAKRIKK
jgi:uncharacterized protein (TIGR03067 family)